MSGKCGKWADGNSGCKRKLEGRRICLRNLFQRVSKAVARKPVDYGLQVRRNYENECTA